MKRLVVDASVLLAGVAGRPQGTPALILSGLLESKFEAVACPHLLREFSRGLASRHFRDRLPESRAAQILAAISESTLHVPDPEAPEAILRDPGDDYLIALAKASGAEAIVTGDKDLLEHEGLEPPAITTRAACELLGLIPEDDR